MKKVISLLVCVMLLFASATTYAAGKLSVVQENFYAINDYWNYGYAYAKVLNAGDKAIKVNAGVLEIYNEAGDVLTSNDYLHAYAEYLEPGEYTYVRMYSEIETGTASDYAMTLTGKSESAWRTIRFPVETDLQLDVKDDWWTHNYMYATITNDAETPIYNLNVVLALLDAEGNILYMDEDGLYTDRALMPGSSIIVRKDIPTSFMDYYKEKGLTPASVDAIAYINVPVN